MSDDVKPYTRESIEHGLREVRNGLRADATIAEVGRAIEALHRVAATARAGLADTERRPSWTEARSILEQGASIQQDYAAGRYSTYEEYAARIDEAAREIADGRRYAALDVTKRSGRHHESPASTDTENSTNG